MIRKRFGDLFLRSYRERIDQLEDDNQTFETVIKSQRKQLNEIKRKFEIYYGYSGHGYNKVAKSRLYDELKKENIELKKHIDRLEKLLTKYTGLGEM